MIRLRSPEHCPACAGESKVMESRGLPAYRWRRRKCLACGAKWRTYESLINPDDVTLRSPRATT